MPYIKQSKRDFLDEDTFEYIVPTCAGELNYLFTALIDRYIKHNGGKSYQLINDAVGALECAKLELYRRIAAPYEDIKIRENTDVYSLDNLS